MALTSFTLRKQTTGLGSYLRQSGVLDTSIRADNLSTSTVTVAGESTFSANVLNDTTIRLEWSLEIPLVLESTLVGASAFSPVELVIASSSQGEPVTIADGKIIERITADNPALYVDDTFVSTQGRWIYYSLFTKYSDGTDYWYELSASLYIQVPIEYNSVDSMWKRIPEYYRSLDYGQTTLSSGYTPLYAFLELFGNELDRTRSLIDSVSLSNDPQLAVTPALSQLAYQTGLEIGIEDLGTAKARSLLNDIGTLRQRKGTVGSIVSYISGMSGCGASYEYVSGASAPHVFHVNAQRVNFISDPQFATTHSTYYDFEYANPAVGYAFSNSVWGLFSYCLTASTTGRDPIEVSYVNGGLTVTVPSSWGSEVHDIVIYPRVAFPYSATETYYCSFDTSASAGASFAGIHVVPDTYITDWAFGTDIPPYSFPDASWNNVYTMTQDTPQRRVLSYAPQNGAVPGTSSSIPVLNFRLSGGQSVYVNRWLWEPGFNGNYFDGDTRDGGYIPSSSGVAGTGVFDYFWGDNGSNSDYSYYLMDRARTIVTTERVLDNYVVPVTMLNSYSLDWNYYPGKT